MLFLFLFIQIFIHGKILISVGDKQVSNGKTWKQVKSHENKGSAFVISGFKISDSDFLLYKQEPHLQESLSAVDPYKDNHQEYREHGSAYR